MASPASSAEGTEVAAVSQPKLSLIPLLLAFVLAVQVSVALLALGAYFMLKSGSISLPSFYGSTVPTKSEMLVHPATHSLVLEPMVVNLGDADGKAYLRLGLILRVEDSKLNKDEKTKEEKPSEAKVANEPGAALRDTTLQVLGRQTADKLLAQDGKEHLKADLKMAIAERNRELKIDDIYFTEFLVQR